MINSEMCTVPYKHIILTVSDKLRKQKPKKKKKINVKKRDNGISYVCCNCGVEEKIRAGVLAELDELYPEQLFLGGHQFECEKCEIGIMKKRFKWNY